MSEWQSWMHSVAMVLYFLPAILMLMFDILVPLAFVLLGFAIILAVISLIRTEQRALFAGALLFLPILCLFLSVFLGVYVWLSWHNGVSDSIGPMFALIEAIGLFCYGTVILLGSSLVLLATKSNQP